MTVARVVVVGSVNVDLVVRVAALPAPGETVLGRRLSRSGGGKGANAAVTAARAGADVSFVGAVGAVGSDDLGQDALSALEASDVCSTHVVSLDGESTGAALITVAEGGENQITVAAGANAALSAEHVVDALSALLPEAGCVLVGTEIAPDAALAAVRAAAAAGVPCVLNPAPVPPSVAPMLAFGAVLTPNAGECRALAAALDLDTALPVRELAGALAARVDAPVVVTLGGDGLLVCSPGLDAVAVPALAVDVVDTTGAGDVANGVLAARLALGDSLLDAARAANAAAADAVTRPGAR